MKTERFEIEMFGPWANRVKKYKTFKEEQKRHKNRPYIDRSKLPILEEDSYVEDNGEDETNKESRDRSPDISFESANDDTLTEKETEKDPCTPSTQSFLAKICSFERSSSTK